MLPIIFAIIPTIVGSGRYYILSKWIQTDSNKLEAMLIGLNDSGQKGALLFGKSGYSGLYC